MIFQFEMNSHSMCDREREGVSFSVYVYVVISSALVVAYLQFRCITTNLARQPNAVLA